MKRTDLLTLTVLLLIPLAGLHAVEATASPDAQPEWAAVQLHGPPTRYALE